MSNLEIPSLRDAYEPFFSVGAAVSRESLRRHRDLLSQHFGILVAENAMKWDPIEPVLGQFDFTEADEIATFAYEHGQKLRAHAPVWHTVDQGLFLNDSGEEVSKEELLDRVGAHMLRFTEHFDGRYFAWDVVNEAISDFPGDDMRDSPWLRILGPNYVDEIFFLAHQYAPDVQLFYNDYNEFVPYKRDRMLRLVKGMIDRGVPIHGMGLQGHVNVVECDLDEYERTVEEFTNLGLRIHITEMDVSPYSLRDRVYPASSLITPEMHDAQARLYRGIFDIARRYKESVDAVLTWGVADDMTWLDSQFTPGRQHEALLFDQHHRIKPWTEQIIQDALA